MSAIVEFLEGRGRDRAGRTVEQVLAFDPEALEDRHDFIQWLFPLPQPSRAVPGSPVLTREDIAAIRASGLARENLKRAAARMADFYGRTSHWLRPSDHNHLRITRIIASLRLLAGDAAADRFREAVIDRVEAAAAPVSLMSLAYWRAA